MKRRILITLVCLIAAAMAHGQTVKRVEPLSWWVGMKTPLQLLIYGDKVAEYDVAVREDGARVTGTTKVANPNYLFVDVAIDAGARAGEYTIMLTKGKKKTEYKYLIDSRRDGSAERASYGPGDMIYLLMPDRFANGDPSNDSVAEAAEKANRSALFGRHGGDIQGIIDRMDYIADLGATALWCTPLLFDNQPEASYHGYACADYYSIDPRYGSNELFRSLVREGHEKGVKTIMDVVTNHCGTAHWWFGDIPDETWFNGTEFHQGNGVFSTVMDPNSSQYDKDNCVRAWFDSPMPDLNTENPLVMHYFRQAFVWWIEWADLDGLRVDTYPYNEKYAIAEWTKHILEEYPGLRIVGECWSGTVPFVAYWEGGTANRDGYDSHLPSVMDFPLQEAWNTALGKDYAPDRWPPRMNHIYSSLAQDFVYREPRNLMTFLDNHDTDRFADKTDGDPNRIKLGITMLATMRGIPQLYAGTELIFRSVDMTQGHGGSRIDFPGGWPGDETNLFDPAQRTEEQADVFGHAAKLFNWRKTQEVIHNGQTLHFLPYNDCYSYFRYDDSKAVFVFVNGSESAQKIEWDRYTEITGRLGGGFSVLDGKSISAGDELAVEGLSSMIIEFDVVKR